MPAGIEDAANLGHPGLFSFRYKGVCGPFREQTIYKDQDVQVTRVAKHLTIKFNCLLNARANPFITFISLLILPSLNFIPCSPYVSF